MLEEIDLRPQLERLDRLVLRSAGVDPAALTFAFRPLWLMDAASKATIALQKAQATQIMPASGYGRPTRPPASPRRNWPRTALALAAGGAARSVSLAPSFSRSRHFGRFEFAFTKARPRRRG